MKISLVNSLINKKLMLTVDWRWKSDLRLKRMKCGHGWETKKNSGGCGG